ncbi:hypothetical protein ACJZ2D_014440 [Fusarium nematophilum]
MRRIENQPDEHSQATTKDTTKEERHEDGTIEVILPNTTHDQITESRFELIQQMEPDNEVDDGFADEGDDDLPDIAELSKRVTASRKRKSCYKLIDLTEEALSPRPDGDINHPTKRSRGELPSAEEVQWTATADEVLKQLQPEGQSLKDSVLQFIMEVLFAIFWPHHEDNKSARVTHPLWFNADEETLPQELRDFENYDVIFFAIHHKGIEHWTVGVLHITKCTIHCDFYDSLPGTTSATKVKDRLKAWIEESGSSRVVTFENKALSKRETQSHDVSHADSLGAENPLGWLPDGEGMQIIPSALAKFVGKAMSFGSLDQLQGRLYIEENRAEKARSDLPQFEAAYENAVAKVNLIKQIYDSDITFMERDVASSGTGSDGVQASSQSLEARIVSLHDEYLHMIQTKANKEALDKLSHHKLREVEIAELKVRKLGKEVTMKSRDVEEADKYISFLRRCVPIMELALELENGDYLEHIGDGN